MKHNIYKGIFITGIIILLSLLAFGDYCHFYWHEDFSQQSAKYQAAVFIFGFTYILTVFLIYTIDLLKMVISLFYNKEVDTLEFYNYLSAVVGFFLYFEFWKALNGNGKCDLILIPNDSGGVFIIICCILTTYWRLKIISNYKNKTIKSI